MNWADEVAALMERQSELLVWRDGETQSQFFTRTTNLKGELDDVLSKHGLRRVSAILGMRGQVPIVMRRIITQVTAVFDRHEGIIPQPGQQQQAGPVEGQTFGKQFAAGAMASLSLHPEIAAELEVHYDTGLEILAETLDNAAVGIHAANVRAGWWSDPATGEPKQRNVFEMLALIHSEISEALEGHRKGLADDKLPHHPMIAVELADAVIRILDLAGALNINLGSVVAEKARFNLDRADHKPAARLAAGGKSV